MTGTELLKAIYEGMQEVKHDVRELKEDVSGLKEDVSVLKEDVCVLKEKVDILTVDVDTLKQNVKRIDLTLENEINRNIRVIAEGHLDLTRKLDAALKVESEREMLLLRMNVLETDVKNLKESIA